MPDTSSAFAGVTIVSNRLPVTAAVRGGRLRLQRSAGGLATGLGGVHERSNGVWLGWPGDLSAMSEAHRAELHDTLASNRLVPIDLTPQEVERYYEGFSNGVIWPLFHYLVERTPLDASTWSTYVAVNRRFAEAARPAARRGDLVWVQDYQLMLVPAMLREMEPEATIGFFLHIPFPSFDVFRLLPWRLAVLEGLLGADLVGFHTSSYARHFLTSLRHLLDVEVADSDALYHGRRVRTGAFPMGIDTSRFETLAASPEVQRRVETISADLGTRQLLVGVDRLDYTKGIPRRLLAFERFLAKHPKRRETVRFIQVAVPSRDGVAEYGKFKRTVNELVGRINGTTSTMTNVPVHYLHRQVSEQELVALYAAASVMVVTPLRDGMNLVAKEFVASRLDDDGVLILSEFAGAADELGDAIIVNPYDIDGVAEAIEQALTMGADERRTRMQSLRRRVRARTVHDWARRFVESLHAARERGRQSRVLDGPAVSALVEELSEAPRLVLLLDYDGTLVPIEATPDLATPDPSLGELLRALAASPRLSLHIVSGRGRDVLETWFGGTGLTLWAEHGLWRWGPDTKTWTANIEHPRGWKPDIAELLHAAAERTAGAVVEDKGDSLAWHYRLSDPLQADTEVHRLRREVAEQHPDGDLETILGSKVLEVRPHGVHKGLAVTAVVHEWPGARLVAIGDDRTDEDMFAALPPDGVAVCVGNRPSAARLRLASHRDVRGLLEALARRLTGQPAPAPHDGEPSSGPNPH
ncbi:MAG: bifunctional alpha,alpha-trehalose-phosphate synthase (UDP-forming)/trehalose-phosphatase [Vicinamibacterales bacterium]